MFEVPDRKQYTAQLVLPAELPGAREVVRALVHVQALVLLGLHRLAPEHVEAWRAGAVFKIIFICLYGNTLPLDTR